MLRPPPREQERLSEVLVTVQGLLEAASARFERLEETVREGLARARNRHAAYLAAPHRTALMNQAFVKQVLVIEERRRRLGVQRPVHRPDGPRPARTAPSRTAVSPHQ